MSAQPDTTSLRERVSRIVESWDFSPLQDEDTRIERLENEIADLIAQETTRQVIKAVQAEREKWIQAKFVRKATRLADIRGRLDELRPFIDSRITMVETLRRYASKRHAVLKKQLAEAEAGDAS